MGLGVSLKLAYECHSGDQNLWAQYNGTGNGGSDKRPEESKLWNHFEG